MKKWLGRVLYVVKFTISYLKLLFLDPDYKNSEIGEKKSQEQGVSVFSRSFEVTFILGEAA